MTNYTLPQATSRTPHSCICQTEQQTNRVIQCQIFPSFIQEMFRKSLKILVLIKQQSLATPPPQPSRIVAYPHRGHWSNEGKLPWAREAV